MRRARVVAATAAVALVGFAVFSGAGAAHAVAPVPVISPSLADTNFPLAYPVWGEVDAGASSQITFTVYTSTDDVNYVYFCENTVDYTELTWVCNGTIPLELGTNYFVATATGDEDGIPSAQSDPVSVEYTDQTPPSFSSPAEAELTSDRTPLFSGTGPLGGTVLVDVGGEFACEGEDEDADGAWSCEPDNPIEVATHTAEATAEDFNGTAFAGLDTVNFDIIDPVIPTVDQTFDPWVTSSPQPEVQGNMDINAVAIDVLVSPDDVSYEPLCSMTNDFPGSTIWFCQADEYTSELTLGTNYLRATTTDEDGFTTPAGPPIQITLVNAPTITSPADGLITNDNTPNFQGTATGTSITVWANGEDNLCGDLVVADQWGCSAGPLADGEYEYLVEVTPGASVLSEYQTITIDTVAPSGASVTSPGQPDGEILSAVTTNKQPMISGTGEYGATVTVMIDESAIACAEGTVLVNEGGTWSCTPTEPLSIGSHSVASSQTDAAGNTQLTPALTQLQLTVVAATQIVVPPQPTPAPTATPGPTAPPTLLLLNWLLRVGGGGTEFLTGDATTLEGDGLPVGAAVEAELHSTPIHLGSTVVGADGAFRLPVVIPDEAEPGAHKFVVTVTAAGAEPSTVEQSITVIVPPAEALAKYSAPISSKDPGSSSGGYGSFDENRNSPGQPTNLTQSLDTFEHIIRNPVVLGTAAAAGIALLLFVAFPAELLNATLSEQYERLTKRLPKLRSRPPWFTRFKTWLLETPILGGIGVTLAAAVIFGFADPNFGFDLVSARVVLACGIALFIVGYLANSITSVFVGRRWRLDTVVELKPLGLILTVIGVVLSRLLEFSPGFLIGLILGIALAGSTTREQQAKTALVRSGIVYAMAITAWIAYSVLSGATEPNTLITTLSFEVLVAITTEGLTMLLIGMLPFRFLEGEVIFQHSKPIWTVSYIIAAASFVAIVVPSASNWGEISGSLWLWVGIVGAFAALALAIYLYFRFWAPPLEDEPEKESEPALSSR